MAAVRRPRTNRVKFSGAFFDGDPNKEFRGNVEEFMLLLSKAGQAEVQRRMQATRRSTSKRPSYKRPTQTYVSGRVRSLSGKKWKATAVVSPITQGLSRVEAISVRAAASVLESKSKPFRRTHGAMRRYAKQIEKGLLKGLA